MLASILIVIALGLGGFYLFNQKSASQNLTYEISSPLPSPIEKASTIPTDNSNLLAGGSSYLDKEGIYNFLYPNDYKLDDKDSRHIRVYKNGPTQKGQTEMYDGVIVNFEGIELENKSLSLWVDDYIKTATADETSKITEPKKEFSVNNYPGFEFKIRGLGEAQYYVLQKDTNSQNAVLITTLVADPTNAGFQKQVDDILKTLQLLK